jgi:uncharacterized protein YjbJ (UPF0337 family)
MSRSRVTGRRTALGVRSWHGRRSKDMNWTTIEAQWDNVKGRVRSEWGKLTGDDLENIKGKRDQLISKIQQRDGMKTEEADKRVQEFIDKLH